MDSEKADLASIHYLEWKYLQKIEETLIWKVP
jgi:hypothetical protein